MWIFTRYGMFSIAVDARGFVVRARVRGHLQLLMTRFALKQRIVELPGRDYGFRIQIARGQWAQIMAALAEEQTWSNFKTEAERYQKVHAPKSWRGYIDGLHDVWGRMLRLQSFGKYVFGGR